MPQTERADAHPSHPTGRGAHRRTQSERRATTRAALLEAAARGISRHGYNAVTLERVAADAGYTRGALYHLFASKEELALAVIDWVNSTWEDEVARPAEEEPDPVAALVAIARGHALYCRRRHDIARVVTALNVEFASRDHPVHDALSDVKAELISRVSRLVTRGRRLGHIPPGPPVRTMARGIIGALEGLVIWVEGDAPYDTQMAERLMLGLLTNTGP
jgi:AcrR family transcriptional regulator